MLASNSIEAAYECLATLRPLENHIVIEHPGAVVLIEGLLRIRDFILVIIQGMSDGEHLVFCFGKLLSIWVERIS